MIESRVRSRRRSVGAVGLAIVAVSLASACGSSNSSSGGGSSEGNNKVATASEASAIIADAGKSKDASWCGTKKIKLGIQDGFGTNGWSKSSMAAVRSEAAKCSNVTQVVQIGLGSLPDSISQINSMVAQNVDAIVMIPDFGKSQLPSIRKATQAGVKMVPWAANPDGQAGRDYVAYVDYDTRAAGTTLANWMAKTLKNKGNIVFLGGPAGNPVSTATLAGIKDSFDKLPNMKLLTGYDNFPVTNWDAAKTQQVMASLLAKYPQIDGVIDDADGFTSGGVLRAYSSAGKKMVPMATFENNQLGCGYAKEKASNPDYQLATISTRNWLGRVAARKAIMAAQGKTNTEPDIYKLPIFDDTTTGKAPNCDSSLPAEGYVSAQLTASDLTKYGKAS